MIENLYRRSYRFIWFIIPLLMVSSCISTKNIPPSNLSTMPENKKVYYFHSGDSIWIVFPIPGKNGWFTGTIIKDENVKNNLLRQVHVHAEPSSVVKIEDHTLTCPMDNIIKVENFKINTGMVIISAGVVILLFMVPVFL